MPLMQEALSLLACPRCRGALSEAGEGLVCGGCRASFAAEGGLPDLLPWSGGAPDPSWSRWQEKLEALQRWREQTWAGGAATDSRQKLADDLATGFFRFARIPESGTVLDVGCGGGGLRAHIPRRRYVGLDPLAGRPGSPALPPPEPGLLFVRGVGEALPFPEAAFEAVMLCEVLDHANDAGRLLAEVHRVLKPGGVLAVLQSVTLARPKPPWFVRLRALAGRLKARLSGRRPGISDLETKVRVLGQDECSSLVAGHFLVESGVTIGSSLFMRALRLDLSAPRPPKRSV